MEKKDNSVKKFIITVGVITFLGWALFGFTGMIQFACASAGSILLYIIIENQIDL